MNDILYALDIGTRKVAGLVGRRTARGAEVLALEVREHRERSMVDGQVHDVPAVAAVVREVTQALERKIGASLSEVALAAAGRTLKTSSGRASLQHSPFEPVSSRDVRFLERLALQDALKTSGTTDQYHCVGYVPVKWILDGAEVSSLEGHRGSGLEAELLATFLPRVVLEGLLGVAQLAGLKTVCIALEPIAALEAVVPPDLRRLNLALVDVGAGTSDIALVRGGNVTAFAMVATAGDEITEALCERFVLEFHQAEKLKRGLSEEPDLDPIPSMDLFGHDLFLRRAEVLQASEPSVAELSRMIADRILDLNRCAPAAVVLVGGGSATAGLAERLGVDLNLESRRLGVRRPTQSADLQDRTGELTEAWGVTPAGILLIAARNKGLSIQHVTLNGTPFSLLRHDAAVSLLDLLAQSGASFLPGIEAPGEDLTFTLDGTSRRVPGLAGRPALIRVNGEPATLGDVLPPDAEVTYIAAERGSRGRLTVGALKASLGETALFLNSIPVVLRPRVVVDGRVGNDDDEIPEGARVHAEFPCRVMDVLRSQGFELDGEVSRQILVSVNGDPRYLTQRNYTLTVNGQEADFERRVQAGDVLVFGRNSQSHYRVGDVVTLPKEGESLRLTVNGHPFQLKGEPGRIFMNGQAVTPDEFVIDHATLVTRDGSPAVRMVSHLLAQMETPKPSGAGQSLHITVDGLSAGFTTSLKEGSSVLIAFE